MSPPNGDEESRQFNSDGPTFEQLMAFIQDSKAFLKLVLDQLEKSQLLDDEVTKELKSLAAVVERQGNYLVGSISNSDLTERDALVRHGLNDGNAELHFKLTAYKVAYDEFMDRTIRALTVKGNARKKVKRSRAALRFLNVILGSVASVIPIAGSVYQETKDEIHAAVDHAVDRSSWGQRAKERFKHPFGGKKTNAEQPAETA